uniref:Uncharacterized protein n=1 Tax=Pithovirus LCDPAC01 TaxID=2506600 RepID=A0A481YQP3_9VIRU|nr:MAG: hypothetical protein LCDPAC01_02240 [Pithovirus LCDPAC01]
MSKFRRVKSTLDELSLNLRAKLSDKHDECSEFVKVLTRYKNDSEFLYSLHEYLRKNGEKLKTRPRMFTVGAFLYGSYLKDDLYKTSNKYSDIIMAGAIPDINEPSESSSFRAVLFDGCEIQEYDPKVDKCSSYSETQTVSKHRIDRLKKIGCKTVVFYDKDSNTHGPYNITGDSKSISLSTGIPIKKRYTPHHGPGSGTQPFLPHTDTIDAKNFYNDLVIEIIERNSVQKRNINKEIIVLAIVILAILYYKFGKYVFTRK